MRHKLAELLRWEGYTVGSASDIEEGLERAAAENPDFVLFDSRIGEDRGLEFLDRYRQASGTALLVLMGPYGSSELATEAVKKGAYDYLPKPFTAEEAVLTLRKAEEREKRRSRKRFGALDRGLWKLEP